AVGEVARTGVHGANRLASNSLLEGAVFGARAGDVIAADAASGAWTPALPARPATATSSDRDDKAPAFTRDALQRLMWQDAGLVRDADGLRHAASVLAAWREQSRSPRTEAGFEDENLLAVATALVDAALARGTSVGAHFRSDAADATPQDRVPVVPASADSRGDAGDRAPNPWSSPAALATNGALAC
ncbi:MAG: L-aspartate oxidase, partial [Microbacterium sp.]